MQGTAPTPYQPPHTHTSFHNLCNPNTYLPKNIKTLLGLGLNFCIQPETSLPVNLIDLDRFRKDMHRIIMFSNTPEEEERTIPTLYLAEPDWQPAEPENEELANRCDNFISTVSKKFSRSKKNHSNLLPNQQVKKSHCVLSWLTWLRYWNGILPSTKQMSNSDK